MAYDYSSFQDYRNRFNNLSKQFDSWFHQFLLKEGMRFIARVKPRTPVDTGDLRNHWQIEGITREGNTLHCWFVNSMEYATHVEYGHAKPYKSGAAEGSADWVQGYFMMTVTIEEIRAAMPSRFDAEFTKFLLSLGVM